MTTKLVMGNGSVAVWCRSFDSVMCSILVNARYAKNVPGRKTDVSDSGWLRQLHSYGLLRGSFRPEAEIAPLRACMRQRERLTVTEHSPDSLSER
jgi:hypothetical protein